MAKPRPEYPPADAVRALADARGRLAFRVTPGARSEAITIHEGRLLIRVRAKPQDGKATSAALALIADALGLAGSRLHLIGGAASRNKLVQIGDGA